VSSPTRIIFFASTTDSVRVATVGARQSDEMSRK
jgi:hypothetical protein